MNVAVIIPQLLKPGGAENFALQCIKHWQHKYEITIYSVSINDLLIREYGIDNNVTLRPILRKQFEGEYSRILNYTILPEIWSSQISKTHDIYFAHLWPMHRLSIRPLVYYPHEPLRVIHDLRYEGRLTNHEGKARRLLHTYPNKSYDDLAFEVSNYEIEALKASDIVSSDIRVVANSHYSKDYFNQVYGKLCSEVVYPGVDKFPSVFEDIIRSDNILITIGQLWSHKRISILINAMQYVDNATLIIIGNGPDQEDYISRIVEAGLESKVFIYTEATNNERDMLLARASLFLFAAIREPFGMVVLEAMSAGLPVIAVDEGGYSEILGDAGILVKPNSMDFAQEINRLLADPAKRSEMSSIGKEIASELSWANSASLLSNIIEDEYKKSYTGLGKSDSSISSNVYNKLFAQYYAWYDEGNKSKHWNDSPVTRCTETPSHGYYRSYSGDLIKHHITVAKTAGIDGFIVSLHITDNGIDTIELESLKVLLEICPEDFYVMPMICNYTQNSNAIKLAVKMLESLNSKSLFPTHPSTNRQLIAVYFNELCLLDDVMYWMEYLSESYSLIFFGQDINTDFWKTPVAKICDGYALYNPFSVGSAEKLQKIWDYHEENSRGSMSVLTIGPGFNDSHLSDPRRLNAIRSYPNEFNLDSKINTLKAQIKHYSLKAPDRLTVLNSFNEFHENSHVEETHENKGELLDIIRKSHLSSLL